MTMVVRGECGSKKGFRGYCGGRGDSEEIMVVNGDIRNCGSKAMVITRKSR